MHMIPVSLAAPLAIASLAAAGAALTAVIIRITLCMLAASATHKALEDLADGQADADALRAHRLAVLRAVLAALSVCGHAETGEDGAPRVLTAQDSPRSAELVQNISEISADDFGTDNAGDGVQPGHLRCDRERAYFEHWPTGSHPKRGYTG
jgi:hypothetical protein